MLVDLSLFAASPTDDRHFAVSGSPSPPYHRSRSAYVENTLSAYAENTFRYHDYHHPQICTMKPLPPLPSRRLGGRRGHHHNHNDPRSCCLLNRIRRPNRADESPFDPRYNTISQRRNIPSPPLLTLSVPQPPQRTRSHTAPSPMVWLPDEQMWLVSDEAQPVQHDTHVNSPPACTRRNYSRSESPPTSYFHYDLTPPLTPVQDQLRSLLEPREQDRSLAASLADREPFQQDMPRAPAMADWSASFFPPSIEASPMAGHDSGSAPPAESDEDSTLLPSRETSTRSVASGVSAISSFDGQERRGREEVRWVWAARRVVRPASTM